MTACICRFCTHESRFEIWLSPSDIELEGCYLFGSTAPALLDVAWLMPPTGQRVLLSFSAQIVPQNAFLSRISQ
jgi:hypothetical protein